MKKKFTFLMMLAIVCGCATFNSLKAQATQDTLVLGEDATENAQYLPARTYTSYSLSQQIYLGSELEQLGNNSEITTFAFMLQRTTSTVRKFKVYMAHTTKSAFSSSQSFAMENSNDLSDVTMVFDGDVEYGAIDEWNVIELSTPFTYENDKNLLVAIYDYSGTYTAIEPRAYHYSTGNDARTVHSNDFYTNFDPSTSHSCNSEYYVSKIQFTYRESSKVIPETPANLTATAESHETIALSWDAAENAESYNIYQDGEKIANVQETSYTANGLTPETQYCYTVTSVNDGTESGHSGEVCVTTLEDGIEELSASFNIYPNPVENELFIATEMNVEEISIYDIYGRQTMRLQVNETTSQQVVNVADLETGVYFVNIKTENGEIVKRFIKK